MKKYLLVLMASSMLISTAASAVKLGLGFDQGFGVTLNFGEQPERLVVPYDTIRTFVDPSVEFGLRFETQDDDEDEDGPPASPSPRRRLWRVSFFAWRCARFEAGLTRKPP